MKTRLIRSTDEGCLQIALEVIQSGGVVDFPTDTVYGIGTTAYKENAVSKLYRVKGRSTDISIPILIADQDLLGEVAKRVSPAVKVLAEAFWPGPLTLVLDKGERIAPAVSATNTVGIRVPDHNFVRELLRQAGPMAVTSANLSGSPSLSSASEVLEEMDGKLELVIDGGIAPGGIPSTVVDCTQKIPIILREGPITKEQIEHSLSR